MYIDNEYKTYVIVNRKYAASVISNASCHLVAGLVNRVGSQLKFHSYDTKESGISASISHYPIVNLQANNSNQLISVVNAALDNSYVFNFFTETMMGISAESQMESTFRSEISELDFIGVALFGRTSELKDVTKKFSVYR